MGVRTIARWSIVAVSASAILVGTGCTGSAAKTPTVASANFDPTAELHVGDSGGLQFALHRVSAESSVPAGSVLLVVNDGTAEHRIQAWTTPGAIVFDTGTLRPGDQTTVVLDEPGSLTVRDEPTGREVSLTVGPRT